MDLEKTMQELPQLGGDVSKMFVVGYNPATGESIRYNMSDFTKDGYLFGGVIEPTTKITAPKNKVIYMATTPGTYTQCGGLVVADGEKCLLVWNGSKWNKGVLDLGDKLEVVQELGDSTTKVMSQKTISDTLGIYNIEKDVPLEHTQFPISRIDNINTNRIRVSFFEKPVNGVVTVEVTFNNGEKTYYNIEDNYLIETKLPITKLYFYIKPNIVGGLYKIKAEFGNSTMDVDIKKLYEKQDSLQQEQTDFEGKVYTKVELNPVLDKLNQDNEELNSAVFSTSLKYEPILNEENILKGYRITQITGELLKDSEYIISNDYISVFEGDEFKVTGTIRSKLTSIISLYDKDKKYIGHDLDGTGEELTHNEEQWICPPNVFFIKVCGLHHGLQGERYTIALSKKTEVKNKTFYTKEETTNSFLGIDYKEKVDKNTKAIQEIGNNRYGVKWQINNPDDLGQRCFDAVGLNATIGIGNVNGQSDFDNIYPWSEMKRCNIKVNANGAKIITYEGEDGFALDGSNGDVFVRIPKFSVEKYIKDGFEYRVISSQGVSPHPAFIENGKEIDEVFISAFEGSIDLDGKMRSISNVIPANNKYSVAFLDAAKLNGEGFTLYDMRSVDLLWTLIAVEYGCRNTNHILGWGLADFWQAVVGQSEQFLLKETTSEPTNTAIVYSSQLFSYMKENEMMLICQNKDQKDILAYRKIISSERLGTSPDYKTKIVFDGEPIVLNDTCFIGTAPQITNWCELCNAPLSWHTGRGNINNRTSSYKQEVYNPIRYRWIENLWGNVWHNLPDVTFHDLQMYVCENIKDYEFFKHDGIKYKPIGNPFIEQPSNGNKNDVLDANFWVNELMLLPFAKGVSFGKGFNQHQLSTQGFGAYYYLNQRTWDGSKWDYDVSILNGGGFDHLWRCNMLTHRAWNTKFDKGWYLYGARMIFKNI